MGVLTQASGPGHDGTRVSQKDPQWADHTLVMWNEPRGGADQRERADQRVSLSARPSHDQSA